MSSRLRAPSPPPRRGPMRHEEPYAESFALAEEGDPRAALLVGLALSGLHQTGLYGLGDHGLPSDPSRAASFLEKAAANAGADEALRSTALYHRAMLVEDEERTSLLQRAAGCGHTEACFLLGSALLDAEGERLLRIAALGGHAQAQFALGIRTIPCDKDAAVRLLLCASLYGASEADWELYKLYKLQLNDSHLRLPPPQGDATGEQEASTRLRRAVVASVVPAMMEMAAQLIAAGRREEAHTLLHRVLGQGGEAAAAAAAALAIESSPC